MMKAFTNLVFEGGGILGISYLGVLDYLTQYEWMNKIKRVGGTSAGAITACITSFDLPFDEMDAIAQSLDYSKIPSKSELDTLAFIPEEVKKFIEDLFGDITCLYRLVNEYGWYSTEYFYQWMKGVIANQFIPSKKRPPYTFEDFKDPSLHKDNHPFLDLYIVGTNLTTKNSSVFSYETTPHMEVAEAVRISMSIPLFFEAAITDDTKITGNSLTNVFCDGGALNNYPLTLFDHPKYSLHLYHGTNMDTLGVRFNNKLSYSPIDNLLAYIESLLNLSSYIQQGIYEANPLNKQRSIIVSTGNVSPLEFNIKPKDEVYRFLYQQGYEAAAKFFHTSLT